jgi:hypothetical protein
MKIMWPPVQPVTTSALPAKLLPQTAHPVGPQEHWAATCALATLVSMITESQSALPVMAAAQPVAHPQQTA